MLCATVWLSAVHTSPLTDSRPRPPPPRSVAREQVDDAAKLVETIEYRAADDAKRSEAKPKDISELEAQNAMLGQLIEVLKPSAPSKAHKDDK